MRGISEVEKKQRRRKSACGRDRSRGNALLKFSDVINSNSAQTVSGLRRNMLASLTSHIPGARSEVDASETYFSKITIINLKDCLHLSSRLECFFFLLFSLTPK